MWQYWTKLLVAFALLSACLPAAAENDEIGSVFGGGQVTLRPKATMLRFQLALSKRGDDMQQVEKALDAKCAAFRKALLAANATPGSIRIDVIKLGNELRAVGLPIHEQQQWRKSKWQYQKAVQMPQQTQAPSTPPAVQGPPISAQPERRAPRIILQTQITADWPLHGSTAAELLVEADAIVRRVYEQTLPITARNNGGSPQGASDEADEPFAANPQANQLPAPNPAPNQATKNQGGPFDSDEASDVDYTPTYVFVGVVSQKELHEAAIRALKEAVANAAAKAGVAYSTIGRLTNIEVSYVNASRPRDEADSDPFGSSTTPAPEMSGALLPPPGLGRAAAATHAGGVEVANYDPSSLQYSVSASVTFSLRPARPRAPQSK